MSNLSDSMGAAIKRRIEKTETPVEAPVTDAKTLERMRSEEAQRRAYEARTKRSENGQ